MADITQNTNDIPELQSPFEQLREVDADGREWWNSRRLARVMGYGKYWNFERVIAKAQAWASRKGYHLGEHFVEITEMAELGSGAVREVISIRLSRAACMAVVMNADQKKEMVKVARQYFSSTMTPDVAVRSMESSVLMYKGGRGKVQVLVNKEPPRRFFFYAYFTVTRPSPPGSRRSHPPPVRRNLRPPTRTRH